MGYFLTTEPKDAVPGNSLATPKTHTPLSQVQERGLRSYSPGLGRWMSRDPIEEDGGPNLSCFVVNDPVCRQDADGLISIESIIQGNIGADASIPILGPYGIPIGASGARFQIHVYFSGNFFSCCRKGEVATFASGTVGAEAYVIWGKGKDRKVPGRDRNKPDPDRPGKRKRYPDEPPDSGYRSRTWHVDVTVPMPACPDDGLHLQSVQGSIFLRGSAGIGVGVQFNLQKVFASGVALDEGWSLTGSVAGDV